MRVQDRPAFATSYNSDVTSSDPGMSEAWWWLALPIATAIGVLVTYQVAPDFYRTYILPEGYGFLELGHFFIPFSGFVLCLMMLRRNVVRTTPVLRTAIIIFGISCFFIAGEEHSWGQWFFYWNTPEFWSPLNRQQETNLHNTSNIFNQIPQTALEIAVLVGGILLPLVPQARHLLSRPPINKIALPILIPSAILLPVSLMAVLFKSIDMYQKGTRQMELIIVKPSEALETFFYLFMLFYLIVLYRRVKAADGIR